MWEHPLIPSNDPNAHTLRRFNTTSHLLSGHSVCLHVGPKTSRIPSLKEDRARSCEFADQAFTAGHAGYNAARGNAFHHVLCIPSYEMPVVYDVAFTILELVSVSKLPSSPTLETMNGTEWRGVRLGLRLYG